MSEYIELTYPTTYTIYQSALESGLDVAVRARNTADAMKMTVIAKIATTTVVAEPGQPAILQ